MTCSIYPHELVALVGGSGTGKSSLLRILAGLQPPQHGHVLLGGEDLYQQLAQYQGSIGYVPQQESLLPYLTVERMLWYAAQLRLPATLTPDAVRQRIDAVLADVELADVRQQLFHTLSGGQRKRVSIALELLAQPLFLFLDEPTTGLDPALEKRFMLLLRSLAERYCTIVIVTHATASLLLCDRVAVLGSGGRLCFYGAPYEVRAFFECSTFAEIYPRVEQSAGGAAGWQLAFRESVYYDEYVEQRLATLPMSGTPTRSPVSPVSPVSPAAPARPLQQAQFGRQTRLLAQRYAELLRGDRRTLVQLLLQAALAGSLIRVVAPPAFLSDGQPPHDGQRVIFLLVITAVLLGVLAAARELTRTRAVYQRERQIGVQPLPYLLAKLIALVPLAGILAGLLLVPVLIGQPLPHGAFLPAALVGLEWWLGLWLALAGGVGMGLLISAVSRSSDQAMSLVPLVLIVQIMLAGLLVPLTGALDLLGNGIVARGAVQSLGNTADLNRLFYQTYASAPPGIFAPDLPAPPDSFRPSDYDLIQLRQYDAAGQSNALTTRRLHLLRVWAGLLVLNGAWVGGAWLALRAAERGGLPRKDC
ncbi:MAG: ATP-binding cassette domain-containing protein [Chloroflexaceae bacterium]|nr:ATP-binding cassette domain-containing protein [Chloroflexaceae bacterium]